MINLNFDKNFFIKDFKIESFLKLRPNLNSLVYELKDKLPKKQFLTIDYSELLLSPGAKTCKDTSWHVDGIDNHYLLICFGDFRTKFLGEKAIFNEDLIKTNKLISLKYKDQEGEEVANGQIKIYTSLDIHKGQVASSYGKRAFLRLCSSDYINPKNKFLIR